MEEFRAWLQEWRASLLHLLGGGIVSVVKYLSGPLLVLLAYTAGQFPEWKIADWAQEIGAAGSVLVIVAYLGAFHSLRKQADQRAKELRASEERLHNLLDLKEPEVPLGLLRVVHEFPTLTPADADTTGELREALGPSLPIPEHRDNLILQVEAPVRPATITVTCDAPIHYASATYSLPDSGRVQTAWQDSRRHNVATLQFVGPAIESGATLRVLLYSHQPIRALKVEPASAG